MQSSSSASQGIREERRRFSRDEQRARERGCALCLLDSERKVARCCQSDWSRTLVLVRFFAFSLDGWRRVADCCNLFRDGRLLLNDVRDPVQR